MSDLAQQPIVLIGAPGAGKSTVGAILAKRLDVPFTDVDQEIETMAGKSVADIFVEDGEPAFRELERRVTLEAIDRPGIVSLGGGAVMNPAIREGLAGHTVLWLQVSAAQATRRVGLADSRPLLAGQGIHSTMVRLLNERLPVYEAVSTHAVDTSMRHPNQVARAAMILLGLAGSQDADQELTHDTSGTDQEGLDQ